jgi:YggT family protein
MDELVRLLAFALRLLSIAIIARAILSFIVPMVGERPPPLLVSINSMLGQITEPVLGPIRRMLPTVGTLDLSPMVAIIVLEILRSVLLRGV